VELEICGVNTAFGVFDENIDQDKRRLLSLSLRANGGRSDEEAGLIIMRRKKTMAKIFQIP